MSEAEMSEADRLEAEIMEKAQRVAALRKAQTPVAVGDYAFDMPAGKAMLSALFAGRERMLVIHGGGAYMVEQCKMMGYDNCPGAVVYELRDGKVYRRARTGFGPGDLYAPIWHLLALAGIGNDEWTPQFHYWSRPQKMDDGGQNLND